MMAWRGENEEGVRFRELFFDGRWRQCSGCGTTIKNWWVFWLEVCCSELADLWENVLNLVWRWFYWRFDCFYFLCGLDSRNSGYFHLHFITCKKIHICRKFHYVFFGKLFKHIRNISTTLSISNYQSWSKLHHVAICMFSLLESSCSAYKLRIKENRTPEVCLWPTFHQRIIRHFACNIKHPKR